MSQQRLSGSSALSGPGILKTSTMTVNLIDGVAVVSLNVPDSKVYQQFKYLFVDGDLFRLCPSGEVCTSIIERMPLRSMSLCKNSARAIGVQRICAL